MHGLGNDFVLVDGFEETLDESTLSQRAIEWCDRHFGIGADGLILILPSRVANFKMRVFNPDGSEAEASGNGIRCFAKYVYEHRKTQDTALTVETLGGIKPVKLTVRGGKVESVRFVLTPHFSPWLAAGAAVGAGMISAGAANNDVYPLLIVSPDAYGIVPLKGSRAAQITVMNPGKPSKSDPLGQKGFVGWKTWHTAVILNDLWMARIETCATDAPV